MQITFDQVSHIYAKGTPFERVALHNISLTIPSGSFVGIIGHTGSGKSTLIQHLNGLLMPSTGQITLGDAVITPKRRLPHAQRRNIGLVFQYPEHQLFEETVAKDVAFGPLNFDLPTEMVEARVKESLEIVGLDYATIKDRSPFHLSGGQMRRVALAGVLAMQPKVLVLDEPTAGLDPAGRVTILEGIYRIHREQNLTTLLVTHSIAAFSIRNFFANESSNLTASMQIATFRERDHFFSDWAQFFRLHLCSFDALVDDQVCYQVAEQRFTS